LVSPHDLRTELREILAVNGLAMDVTLIYGAPHWPLDEETVRAWNLDALAERCEEFVSRHEAAFRRDRVRIR